MQHGDTFSGQEEFLSNEETQVLPKVTEKVRESIACTSAQSLT
jgi:hypothetical protein